MDLMLALEVRSSVVVHFHTRFRLERRSEKMSRYGKTVSSIGPSMFLFDTFLEGFVNVRSVSRLSSITDSLTGAGLGEFRSDCWILNLIISR